MKYPKYLNKGDSIRFFACSFGSVTSPYVERNNSAKRKLTKLGYSVSETDSVSCAELPYLANKPEILAKEFVDSYGEVNALVSVGGGELQCETLPFIDFEKLKDKTPTWHLGFSDNTNYAFLLETLADTASIYGMCASDFGMYNWDQSIKDCYNIVTGSSLTVKGYPRYQWGRSKYRNVHPLAGYHYLRDKELFLINGSNIKMTGRVIGGCLDVLDILCGTKYDKVSEFLERYKEDGFIWFIEACDFSPLQIRRSLFKLREAGWFKYANGFVVGRPARAMLAVDFEIDRHEALDPIKSLGLPIIADADLGHVKPTMPVVLGSIGTVTAKGNDLKVVYELK